MRQHGQNYAQFEWREMEHYIRSGWKIPESLTKKLELIKNYDLAGVAEWKLGSGR